MYQRLSHLALKVLLGMLAAVFAACVLVVALVLLVISLLKSLLTWRKPALLEAFMQFRRFRAQAVWPRAPAGQSGQGKTAGDVVDVEVKEISQSDKRN